MIQRRERDYQVSLWSLQDSLIAILKQYGREFKGQIQDGKLTDKDDGTQSFTFTIPMYYYKDGEKIENPSWYNVQNGALLANMRKIKVIFNKDNVNRKIYEFLIVKVSEEHDDENSLYCDVQCEGLAFHQLGKIGYKISLSADDFYNDDYDWATTGSWYNVKIQGQDTTQPLATLNYWNDKVFNTVSNWTYEIKMDWTSYSLEKTQKEGVLEDYTPENDTTIIWNARDTGKVYEEDFVDSWDLKNSMFIPAHITHAREKARVSIDLKDSNIYNITQSLAESFGVFCRYEYEHNNNAQIIGRKVIYYNNFLNEQDGIKDITYPYQTNSIKREIDSTDLVTKLFVKSVDDNNGSLSIIDVGANKSQEDYILNFDYLYKIGGITEQQYKAVEEYIIKIRSLNDQLKPLSAKVISLQSRLVKLQAEFTTCKNAVVLDTEQVLSNTALRDAITDGNDIITILASNPQTAVLLQDATETRTISYYVKMTQKGVYGQTIRLYKTYDYNSHKLTDEITTKIINYDDSGEVTRISNIFINENDSKTVYITYSYQPKLYYDRVVKMWENRLYEDTARKTILQTEIAQLKYSLYGEKVKQGMRGIDVSKLLDIQIDTKYQNVIKEKEQLIKEFNAMMGPALREGYWQPEDYNDYGDQYNDRFIIKLNNVDLINGTTGNTYFKWDDELFESEQDIYYNFGADEVKQAYPCINLTTAHGRQILKMISENPDKPISFVFKPKTYNETNKDPTVAPIISNKGNNSITLIPGLYTWAGDNEYNTNIVTGSYFNKLPLQLQEILGPDEESGIISNNYDGKLTYECSQGWGFEAINFSWDIAQLNNSGEINESDEFWSNKQKINFSPNLTTKKYNIKYTQDAENYIRSYINTQTTETDIIESNGFSIRLLSDNNASTLDNSIVRLCMNNTKRQESGAGYTKIRTLKTSTISLPSNISLIQYLLTNSEDTFNISYTITNQNSDDLMLNYYTWKIIDSDGNKQQTITYLNNSTNNKVITGTALITNPNFSVTTNNNTQIHTLTISPENIHTNNKLTIQLLVQNPLNFLKTTVDYIVAQSIYTIQVAQNKAPLCTIDEESKLILTYQQNSENNNFKLSVNTQTVTQEFNNNLTTQWQIKNDNTWVDFNSYLNNANNININETWSNNSIGCDNKVTLTLSILNGEQGIEYLNNKLLRVRIGCQNDYSSWVEFSALQFTLPIQINNDWNATQPVLLSATSQSVNFSFSSTNTTKYIWYIKQNNNSNPITLTVDQNTTSVATQDNRYQAKYQTVQTGSKATLTLVIPAISSQQNTRDDGTQIRCVCTNLSEYEAYYPAKENNNIQWYTIKVAYPIEIITNSSYITTTQSEWWAIENKNNKVGEIYFSIPSLIDENNSNNNKSIEINLYGPFTTIPATINNLVLTSLFNITSTIQYVTTINNNNIYKANIEISLKPNNSDNIKISGQSIIDKTTVNNNYKLLLTAQIKYQYKTTTQIKTNYSFVIIIKQDVPSYSNNFTLPSGATSIEYEYNSIPFTINVEEFFNINSIESYSWENDITDGVNSNLPQKNTPITIQRSQSTQNIQGITQFIYTTSTSYPAGPNGQMATITNSTVFNGYNNNLYLKVTNPWGSKTLPVFTFTPKT